MGVKKSCTFYAVSQIISVPTRLEVCGDVCVDDKYIFKLQLEKSAEKSRFGRPRRGWENNIKVNVREIICNIVVWIEVAQNTDQWQMLSS